MRCMIVVLKLIFMSCVVSVAFADCPSSWHTAKNIVYEKIYFDHQVTLYCGCLYKSAVNDDGNRTANFNECGILNFPDSYSKNRENIEVEHIVPAALTPARQKKCWTERKKIEQCENKSSRECCILTSSLGRRMLLDFHNLAPSLHQINRFRSNDRYGEVGKKVVLWEGCDVLDENGTSKEEGKFEPPDCVKGDVARVWLYMKDKYRVFIPEKEYKMFLTWALIDPVSAWERLRDKRIQEIQGDSNPYVRSIGTENMDRCMVESSSPVS